MFHQTEFSFKLTMDKGATIISHLRVCGCEISREHGGGATVEVEGVAVVAEQSDEQLLASVSCINRHIR